MFHHRQISMRDYFLELLRQWQEGEWSSGHEYVGFLQGVTIVDYFPLAPSNISNAMRNLDCFVQCMIGGQYILNDTLSAIERKIAM